MARNISVLSLYVMTVYMGMCACVTVYGNDGGWID